MAKLTAKEVNENIASHGKKLNNLENHVRDLNTTMIGITIALFIVVISMAVGLGGMILDTVRSKEATYQDLVNKINAQQSKLDAIGTKLRVN